MAAPRGSIGKRVRRWRRGQKLTLAHVAARIGTSESLLCRYELGAKGLPLKSVGPLSALSGIPVGDLMTEDQRRAFISVSVPTVPQDAA